MVQFNTRIKTSALIDIVRGNLNRHQQIYKEAVDGFLKEARKKVGNLLEEVKNNDGTKNVYISLACPTNNVKEYQSAIRMLELTEDEEIELTHQDFENLVMDRWSWQHKFLNSVLSYSNTASGCMTEIYGSNQ